MMKLKCQLIAYPDAPQEIIERGETLLKNKIQSVEIDFTNQHPDALFIVTGGSENQAKHLLEERNQVLLLAMTESNSYAAASEIKSYCLSKNILSTLYNIDHETNINYEVENYLKSKHALSQISQYKIGLIGHVSEWLINSNIDNNILNQRLGIELEQISWNDFPAYDQYESSSDFLDHFSNNGFELDESSKVYKLLQDIIDQKQLDAITVECFPLVRENAVTACLGLSLFNTIGLPAGCEGDMTSITGKIIAKELTGQIPWMANLASVNDDGVFFAHCTIATNLVSDYKINTHFETGLGTAIQGRFKSENATVFRLNRNLNKAFLSYGRIVERPERNDSCRTQIKIELPNTDIQKLKENPLGNHHLIIPGNYTELLKHFFTLIEIEIV